MWTRIFALAVPLLLTSTATAEVTRVDLRLDKALVGGKTNDWVRTVHISVLLRDGQSTWGRIGAERGGTIGGWNIVPWAGRVDRVNLRRDGDKITGTLEAYISSNAVNAGQYTFTIDARIAEGKVTGGYEAKVGDTAGKGPTSGDTQVLSSQAPVDPGDSLYTVVLDKAMPRGEALKLYLDRKDGRFRTAFAFCSPFSRRPYEVDASGLTLRDGTIEGTVKILRTLSRKEITTPLLGSFHIKASVQQGDVKGSHTGAFGEDKGEGAVWGELLARRPVPENMKVWVKLEDGLFGGADWQNRAFFNFFLMGGKANGGTLFNNKGVYKGKLDRAEITLDGQNVKGTMHGTILSGGVTHGAYTFELNGMMIGDVLAGTFTTKHGDKSKQGYFVGGFGP